jgi:hypothetical protein
VTPLEPNVKYSKKQEATTKEEVKTMEVTPYREAIGSLMYLMVSTRPDLGSKYSGIFKVHAVILDRALVGSKESLQVP